MKNNMMNTTTSLMQNLQAMKKTSSRRMMSRMQYRYVKEILQFHYVVDGNIVGYKARLVAQGFSQKEGINYEETFASTRS